jgi:hypothetical protein
MIKEKYGFVLNFDELPLEQKFEEWKEYNKRVGEITDEDILDDEKTDKLRNKFEEEVKRHFPIYF